MAHFLNQIHPIGNTYILHRFHFFFFFWGGGGGGGIFANRRGEKHALVSCDQSAPVQNSINVEETNSAFIFIAMYIYSFKTIFRFFFRCNTQFRVSLT